MFLGILDVCLKKPSISPAGCKDIKELNSGSCFSVNQNNNRCTRGVMMRQPQTGEATDIFSLIFFFFSSLLLALPLLVAYGDTCTIQRLHKQTNSTRMAHQYMLLPVSSAWRRHQQNQYLLLCARRKSTARAPLNDLQLTVDRMLPGTRLAFAREH